jgi:phage tail-like protein
VADTERPDPFIPFRFTVSLRQGGTVVCGGAFSEVTGLELTMTPKKFSEGGRNFGEVQLAGPTAFGTIVLKRGVTSVSDLWTWFDAVANQANYGYRLDGEIQVRGSSDTTPVFTWKLKRVMPIKFKGPDLSAAGGTQVAVEELHLVCDELTLERPGGP